MKTQEAVIDHEKGTQYWNIFFQVQTKNPLTKIEWELINNQINKMIYEFEKKQITWKS